LACGSTGCVPGGSHPAGETCMRRWAIYIDIEGFSAIYSKDEVRALRGLGAVMEAVYRIGSTVCAERPNRLFVHQTGDGFVVVSDWVHAELPEVHQVAEAASIALPQTAVVEERLRAQVESAKGSVSAEWVKNTLTLNGSGSGRGSRRGYGARAAGGGRGVKPG